MGVFKLKKIAADKIRQTFFFFFYRVTIIGHIIIIFVNFDQRQEQKLGERKKTTTNFMESAVYHPFSASSSKTLTPNDQTDPESTLGLHVVDHTADGQ